MILETNWDITTTICQLANSGADLPSLISVMNDNYDKLDSQNLDAFITAITITDEVNILNHKDELIKLYNHPEIKNVGFRPGIRWEFIYLLLTENKN